MLRFDAHCMVMRPTSFSKKWKNKVDGKIVLVFEVPRVKNQKTGLLLTEISEEESGKKATNDLVLDFIFLDVMPFKSNHQKILVMSKPKTILDLASSKLTFQCNFCPIKCGQQTQKLFTYLGSQKMSWFRISINTMP